MQNRLNSSRSMLLFHQAETAAIVFEFPDHTNLAHCFAPCPCASTQNNAAVRSAATLSLVSSKHRLPAMVLRHLKCVTLVHTLSRRSSSYARNDVAETAPLQLRFNTALESKRESSADVVHKDGTGAKRMTGLVTRDSAQRRPIDEHRSDARLTDVAVACPSPTRPTGCRRAVPGRAFPPPDPEPGRHHCQCARCSTRTAP